jgi:hypothetical protein
MSYKYDTVLSSKICCHFGGMSLHFQAKRLFYAKDKTGKFIYKVGKIFIRLRSVTSHEAPHILQIKFTFTKI